MKLFFLLAVLLQFQWQALSVEKWFQSPANTTCACPGEVLIYNCTVNGGSVTIWGGSAFDCAENEITFIHDNFIDGTAGECNDGAIVGQSVYVDGRYYTSQLNVTVSVGLNDKTVTCSSDSMTMHNIGESRIKVAANLAPDNIYLVGAHKDKLLFSWTPIALNNCFGLKYSINSNCGICSSVTNRTTATCSDLHVSTNADVCHFSVSSVVCDQAGDPSSPVSVMLKVPNVPLVNVIPSYSNDSQALEKLFIVTTMNQTEDFFTISGNISGSPTSYSANSSNLVSGSSFNSIFNLSSCEEGSGCPIILPSSYCPPSTLDIISVTISAANKLGEGPPSKPFMIDCTNTFVQILYNETTFESESTIFCEFQNQFDTSEKTCCVTHQLCDQEWPKYVQECNNQFSYRIELKVSVHSSQRYCYTVTASNDTYTVKVEGNFTTGPGHLKSANVNSNAAIIAIVATMIGLGICIVFSFFTIVFIAAVVKLRENGYLQQDPLKDYLIPYNPTTCKLKPHKVFDDCELQNYLTESLALEFRRGHIYYEFTNEVENILEGKQILLQDKRNSKSWFKFNVKPDVLVAGGLKLYGEGIARKSFGGRYRVFIQSFGSGARYLPKDSSILYNHGDQIKLPDLLQLAPVQVCSKHFASVKLRKECTVKEFCEQKNLRQKAFNIFVDLEHRPDGKPWEGQSPRDVILMDKESSSSELFTGPYARQMLTDHLRGGLKNEKLLQFEKKWKIFVLLRKENQKLVLKKNAEILCQDLRYLKGKYALLEVDKHCVMSKFIKAKLNIEFEYGKAFYEATGNEDLECYKKILLLDEHVGLSSMHQELIFESPIEFFYAIRGVPSKAVKLEFEDSQLRRRRVFIQSSSQGSRCLKKGAKLLYLKEYIDQSGIRQTEDPNKTKQDQLLNVDKP